MIRRGFVDVAGGQVHYRMAGGGDPLVMLHASPGSSKQLEGLMAALAVGRRVIAPDTRGNGDSTPLSQDAPTIFDFANAAVEAINQLEAPRFDLYGTHTGASIAMEIAIAHPDRVRRLVLDGMGLYSAAEQDEMLRTYAPEVAPDFEARYVMWAWHFARDAFVFWPWFKKAAENRRAVGIASPEVLHDRFVEVLKAITSYHHSYRAAFRHPKRERLPLIGVPTLCVCGPNDMLRPNLEAMTALVPGARMAEITDNVTAQDCAHSAATIGAFLNGVQA
jgi:pimeloyl-ACP methyl ester carboxylesterase